MLKFLFPMAHLEKLREVQGEIRELINWVKVFEEEYDLEKEVVDTLCNRLKKISESLSQIVE